MSVPVKMVAVEKLRNTVRHVLRCVINLHIDILILEANVNQLLDEVKEINADLLEMERLDKLITTLRDYDGPTICHEWPYPLLTDAAVDEADIAQSLPTPLQFKGINATNLAQSTTPEEHLKFS